MNYRLGFWLSLFGVGALWILRSVLEAVSGAVGVHVIVPFLAGAALSVASALALGDLEDAGGPDGPTFLFVVAVVALLLMVAMTVPVLFDVVVAGPAADQRVR